MKHFLAKHLALSTLSASLLAGGLPAQSAASKSWFLVAGETAPGGRCTSTSYVLHAGSGSGVVAAPSTSKSFRLLGGSPAGHDLPVAGQPWLTEVTPRYATPKSGAVMTLLGAELAAGTGPSVHIGGQKAVVLSRKNDQVTVRLPEQPVPGWQPVEFSSTAGKSALTQGVGVLPMIATDSGPGPDLSFNLLFKGSQGDLVILAGGLASISPIALPGIRHGLSLHPAAMVILGSFTIPTPSGELRVPVPPTSYSMAIFGQAMFSTSNPGYGPASFSNLLQF